MVWFYICICGSAIDITLGMLNLAIGFSYTVNVGAEVNVVAQPSELM